MTALLLILLWTLPAATASTAAREEKLERSIQRKLGRPYAWGATGLRSYDCSGFVWRAFRDAGVFFKRTTVRKMFHTLPVAGSDATHRVGTLVFFNRLDHVAIVRNQAGFYHASSSRGTVLDGFNTYWLSRVCGYRTVGRRSQTARPANPATRGDSKIRTLGRRLGPRAGSLAGSDEPGAGSRPAL